MLFMNALSQKSIIVCTTVGSPDKKKSNLVAPEHKSLRSGATEANAELSAPMCPLKTARWLGVRFICQVGSPASLARRQTLP
jgi:hypothetical protein